MLKLLLISFSMFVFAQDLPHPSGHSTYKELKGQLFTFKILPKDKNITLEVVGIPKLKIDFSKVDLEVKYIGQDKKVVMETLPFNQEKMMIPVKPGLVPESILIREDKKVLDTLRLKID